MPTRVIVAAVALVSVLNSAARTSSIGNPASDANVERHHYSINARVRPLLFWIDCRDVGDAIVTVRRHGDGTGYSLLIGSDPQRTPQRINRWGYLDEDTHGTSATVIGLMTESDERSLAQAKANVETSAATQMFKLIRSSVTSDEARSLITAMAVPSDYSFRQVRTVLDLARRASVETKTQVVRLPSGTRPGFLTAVADVVRTHVTQWQASRRVDGGEPVRYIYRGRIYELRAIGTRPVSNVQIGEATYEKVITSEFVISTRGNPVVSHFSMTYGAEGRYAAVPLSASFQPRWWLQIELTLDDTTQGRSTIAEVTR
jgi:hypothetical protein